MIQKGVREWKKDFFGRGEGFTCRRLQNCQYRARLVVRWCSLSFSPESGLDECILVYAEAAQFAMISLIGLTLRSWMALTVCLINLRNMLMSLHTSSDFKDASLAHTIGIGSLPDRWELWGLLEWEVKDGYHYSSLTHGNNLVGYVAWISAMVIGTALGSLLPDPKGFWAWFLLLAMFIGFFAAQFQGMQLTRKDQDHANGALSSSSEFSYSFFFFSQTIAVLAATLIGCFAGGWSVMHVNSSIFHDHSGLSLVFFTWIPRIFAPSS